MNVALRTLIERLEKAEEGSEELDVAICRAIHGYGGDQPLWYTAHYTRSLDAALSLVPTGWLWIAWSATHGEAMAEVFPAGARNRFGPRSFAKTAPLALCIACLRARLKEHDHG